MSQSVCLRVRERERRGENRRLARQLNHVIENAYQTDSAPSVCLPPTHGHSTPIPCGSRPIRALVHCYSNHGARWGGSPGLHGNCICLQRVKEDRWSALSSPCQSDARLSENVCGFFLLFFFFYCFFNEAEVTMSTAGGVFTLTIISVFNGAINQGAAERNDHSDGLFSLRCLRLNILWRLYRTPCSYIRYKLNRAFI